MGNNLKGRKIAILIESDYYEPEIHYYQHRFAEEGAEVHFVSRMWGNSKLTFLGHEARMPFECTESFETIDDAELATYAAVIVPSGMVSDRLRYTEDVTAAARHRFPAPRLRQPERAQGHHLPRHVAGRADAGAGPRPPRGRAQQPPRRANNMGAVYVNEDVVVDGDRSRSARAPLPPLAPARSSSC
jgi:protease I